MTLFDHRDLVVFDLDGTLIDSIGVWNERDRRLRERLGLPTLGGFGAIVDGSSFCQTSA